MKDPYRYFRVEARELVDGLSRDVLALEGDPGGREEITARLLRLAHTLKGAARVVGQAEIADEAHALEGAIAAGAGADELLARVDTITARLSSVAPAPESQDASREGGAARGPAPASTPISGPAPEDATHVDLDAVDLLLESLQDARGEVGALGRAAARLDELGRRGEARSAIQGALRSLSHEIGGAVAALDGDLTRLGARAHEVRLVPASTLFGPLARAARDAARVLGKRVVFEARGGDNHLDGRVLSLVRSALLHVVKNAVDHGIEGETERSERGKPPAGRIELEVSRRGHRISFACRDDGRGIDVEALQRCAAGRTVKADGDATQLVFAPGLSTRAEVTPISGRGIGLDAVRDIAARLKGEVSVQSEPGQGAVFVVTVPVSLSSMPVLVVGAGELCAAIPLDAVRRVQRLEIGAVARLGEREAVLHAGRPVPLLRLEAWVSAGAEAPAEPRSAVIVEAERSLAAVGVDRVLGASHVVLQPIAAITGALPALGALLDSDGVPVPVLDPAALVAAASAARSRPGRAAAPPKSVLVIDDSLTTRMLEQSILSSAGYHVDAVSSAEEGLELARVTSYDLFVVDVEMPGMDGFAFVAQTKAEPALSAVPSIIVSSRASDADKRRGAVAGARAYMVKSEFAEEGFLELVRGLVR